MLIACHATHGDGSVNYYRYAGPQTDQEHDRIRQALADFENSEHTEGMFEVVEPDNTEHPVERDGNFCGTEDACEIEDADELVKTLCWWALGAP